MSLLQVSWFCLSLTPPPPFSYTTPKQSKAWENSNKNQPFAENPALLSNRMYLDAAFSLAVELEGKVKLRHGCKIAPFWSFYICFHCNYRERD